MRRLTTVSFSISLLLLIRLTAQAQVQPSFDTAPQYTGGFPVAIADFNQDGNHDIVSGISMLLGNGDGTFRTGTPLNVVPMGQYYIATADFNGDGKPDIAFLNVSGLGQALPVLIFLGKGDGTFQSPISITPASSFSYFVVADVNNDGKPDLLTMDGGALVVYLGNGDGTFKQLAANFSQTVQYVGDFNGDGKPDILSAPGFSVYVWLGNGDGTFQTTPVVSNFGGRTVAAVADFNHDGKLDLGVVGGTSCGSPDYPGVFYTFGYSWATATGLSRPSPRRSPYLLVQLIAPEAAPQQWRWETSMEMEPWMWHTRSRVPSLGF